jgi:peroxiredoxin
VPAVGFGEPVPPGKFANMNSAPGQPASVDLASLLGKKPIVVVYWMPSNARSEKILQETQAIVDSTGADKVVLLSFAAPPFGSTDTTALKARTAELKLKCPVLYDEGFRLLQQLQVHSVPNVAIIDIEGKLRLSNGGSLKQTLEYKLDVEGAIRRVASTGKLGTYGMLQMYYPVTELVGKKCPDFDAPLLSDGVSHSFNSMLSSTKVNVLVFWSVDCPHCKASLPKLNDWLKGHQEGMNVIGAARVTDDATKTRTAEYCRISGFVFPTFVDKDMQIGGTYQVISTPTVVVIRPDGVVDSVLLSGETDLGQALEAKKREILKTPPPKG